MDKTKVLKTIEILYEKHNNIFEDSMHDTSMIGIRLIEQEARKILSADDGLYDFIMAMGTCFFTTKKGSRYDSDMYTDESWDEWCESEEYVHVLNGVVDEDNEFLVDFTEMVEELNFKFNVKGYPMRFTATSEVMTDWTLPPYIYTERKPKYFVQADHCILKRIDERFYKEENALKLIKELCEHNYENIKLNGRDVTHEFYKNL